MRRTTLILFSVALLATGCDRMRSYYEVEGDRMVYESRVDVATDEEEEELAEATDDALDPTNPLGTDSLADETYDAEVDTSEAKLVREAKNEKRLDSERGRLDGMTDGAMDASKNMEYEYHYSRDESYEYIQAYEQAYLQAFANSYETMVGK